MAIEKGRQQGQAALLRRLLGRQFGVLPSWVEERLSTARQEALEAWGERILCVKTLEEVFAE
jgi:hypothetical protein